MAETKGFMLYHNYTSKIAKLSDDERGRLLMALLVYSETGDRSGISGREEMVFDFIADDIDRDASKYQAIVERNRRNIASRHGSSSIPERTKATSGKSGEPDDTTPSDQLPNDPKTKPNDKDKDNSTDVENPPIPPTGGSAPDWTQQRFDEFWCAYPKKVGKGAALTAWKKLKLDGPLFLRIMTAVKNAKGSDQWQRENGRYIPNTATWLNQGRWDDELPRGGTTDGRANQADPTTYIDDDDPF